MLRKLRPLATLVAALSLVGCEDPDAHVRDEGDAASVSIPLETVSTSGAVYRLRELEIDIVGPVSITLSSDDFAADATSMTASLPGGAYVATVRPGWKLDRMFDGTPVTVNAALAQTSYDITVSADGPAAPVPLLFRTFDDFAEAGDVVVSFTVDDSPPSAWQTVGMLGVPAAIASDDSGRVFALRGNSGFTQVQAFNAAGVVLWTTNLPMSSSANEQTAYDVQALDFGRVRVAWVTSRVSGQPGRLNVFTLDALTGVTIESEVRQFEDLGISGGIFGGTINATVAVGDGGAVVLATMPSSASATSSMLVYLDTPSSSPFQLNLGALYTNKVRIDLVGIEERVLLAVPNGAMTTVQLRNGINLALLWQVNVTNQVTGFASTPAGGLFAVGNLGVQSFSPATGAPSAPFPLSSGSTTITGGGLGVATTTLVGGGFRIRRFSDAGAFLGERSVAEIPSGDTVTDLSLDALGGVAYGVRHLGTLGMVGRVVSVP